jgi:hypothetical protein
LGKITKECVEFNIKQVEVKNLNQIFFGCNLNWLLNFDKLAKKKMKPGSTKWKMFYRNFRLFTNSLLALGVLLFILEVTVYGLIGGGIMYSLLMILNAFKPIHEDPNWELVFPELALGYQHADDSNDDQK